jgi:hypothetical protein
MNELLVIGDYASGFSSLVAPLLFKSRDLYPKLKKS